MVEIKYDPPNSEDISDSESELPPKEDSRSDSDEEKEEYFNHYDEIIGKYINQEYSEVHMEGINRITLIISHFRRKLCLRSNQRRKVPLLYFVKI